MEIKAGVDYQNRHDTTGGRTSLHAFTVTRESGSELRTAMIQLFDDKMHAFTFTIESTQVR